MQTPEICICASARAPKVRLHCPGPRANHVPVPEPIRLPKSDKRRAWAHDAGHCNSFRARSGSMGEACGHALHNGPASLAPFHPVVKANQTEMVVPRTAQVIDVAQLWAKQD